MTRSQQLKPAWCVNHCSYRDSSGFAPDDSEAKALTAKVAFLLEAAGADEEYYSRPLAGATGRMVFKTFVEPLGHLRSEVLVANTIRCHPPGNRYPTGSDKVAAESNCRRWDAILDLYSPDLIGTTYHPADLFDEKQRFTLVRQQIRRAFWWADRGRRPVLLMGVRARQVFMPHLKGDMKTWQGHWEEIVWKPRGALNALVEIRNIVNRAPEYRG